MAEPEFDIAVDNTLTSQYAFFEAPSSGNSMSEEALAEVADFGSRCVAVGEAILRELAKGAERHNVEPEQMIQQNIQALLKDYQSSKDEAGKQQDKKIRTSMKLVMDCAAPEFVSSTFSNKPELFAHMSAVAGYTNTPEAMARVRLANFVNTGQTTMPQVVLDRAAKNCTSASQNCDVIRSLSADSKWNQSVFLPETRDINPNATEIIANSANKKGATRLYPSFGVLRGWQRSADLLKNVPLEHWGLLRNTYEDRYFLHPDRSQAFLDRNNISAKDYANGAPVLTLRKGKVAATQHILAALGDYSYNTLTDQALRNAQSVTNQMRGNLFDSPDAEYDNFLNVAPETSSITKVDQLSRAVSRHLKSAYGARFNATFGNDGREADYINLTNPLALAHSGYRGHQAYNSAIGRADLPRFSDSDHIAKDVAKFAATMITKIDPDVSLGVTEGILNTPADLERDIDTVFNSGAPAGLKQSSFESLGFALVLSGVGIRGGMPAFKQGFANLTDSASTYRNLMQVNGDLRQAYKAYSDDLDYFDNAVRLTHPRFVFHALYGKKFDFDSLDNADEGFIQYMKAKNTNNEIVLGRLYDTAAGAELGFTRLHTAKWDLGVNDSFIQGGLDAGKPFYLGSNPHISNYRSTWDELYRNRGSYPETVFLREMRQLRDAGYWLDDSYHMKPSVEVK